MNTASITRALRKSDLVEYKVLTRHTNNRVATYQDGWELRKFEDHVSVWHTGIDIFQRETHMKWAQQVVAVLTSAGLQAEIVMRGNRSTLTGISRPHIHEIRVTEAGK